VKPTLGVESSTELLHHSFDSRNNARANEQISRAERTMNLYIADTNVIETEVSELQVPQTDETIIELSSFQLLMVGGGSGTAILT
jgi:hypothetical protein